MSALYVLAQEFREAAEKLADADLPAEVVQDTLESLQFPFEEKAKAVAMMIRNEEADAKAITEAAEAMQARARTKKSRANYLTAYLLNSMIQTGVTRIESPLFVLSVGAGRESVAVDDESRIPADYIRETPATFAPDKPRIKEAIKAGIDVPGCRLARSQSLQIK